MCFIYVSVVRFTDLANPRRTRPLAPLVVRQKPATCIRAHAHTYICRFEALIRLLCARVSRPYSVSSASVNTSPSRFFYTKTCWLLSQGGSENACDQYAMYRKRRRALLKMKAKYGKLCTDELRRRHTCMYICMYVYALRILIPVWAIQKS